VVALRDYGYVAAALVVSGCEPAAGRQWLGQRRQLVDQWCA